MPTTFGNLIDEVFLSLEGWGLSQGRAAFITTAGGINSSATAFAVADASNLSEGVAEIDDELVYIQSISGLNVTIAPDGRGYRGTTAAAHAQNARVTMNPVLPRAVVKQKLNDTIAGVYPTLRGKAVSTFSFIGAQATYALPAEVDSVLSVTYDSTGPSGFWPAVYGYRFDANANTTDFPNGKTITLLGGVEHGRTVQVVYLKKPSALSATSDLLTASGLADTARSVIIAGAIWRLSSYIAAARLRVDTAVVDMMDEQSPIQDANRVAAYLRAQYELELQEERKRQELSQPPTMTWTG